MKLDTYMKANGLTDAEMARRCACSQPHMWKVRTGNAAPSASLMMRIHLATDGAVTANDLATPAPHAAGEAA